LSADHRALYERESSQGDDSDQRQQSPKDEGSWQLPDYAHGQERRYDQMADKEDGEIGRRVVGWILVVVVSAVRARAPDFQVT